VTSPKFAILVLQRGWPDLFRQHNLLKLEQEVLPAFLPRQRWFWDKGQRVNAAKVLARGEIVRAAENEFAGQQCNDDALGQHHREISLQGGEGLLRIDSPI
jgi:hypothetical protein